MTPTLLTNNDVKAQSFTELNDVKAQSFTELFESSDFPLAIDNYQRPFVWGKNKVNQLINDLVAYSREQDERQPLDYYMGTVLLHRSHDRRQLFIIDGQQRLTALSILHYVRVGYLPDNHDFSYRSPQSAVNIQQARKCFQEKDLNALASDLFSRIRFTLIVVQSEDLAFNFFDTQNNRGVPLNATDLLKAYHLRAIQKRSKDKECLQRDCAKRWERLQNTRPILGHGTDFAPVLFHEFLWRARRWTGQKLITYESYDDILKEFQEHTIPCESPDTMPIYPSCTNCLGASLAMSPQGDIRLMPQPLYLTHHPGELPFAIRQPISEGLGFFLYADKYTGLIKKLLQEKDPPSAEVKAFRKLYQEVIAHLSLYLRELFLLASVMYVDQFGYRQLLHFALWLEHALGAIRLEKQYVFAKAPLIYLRDKPLNLLDVIAGAFRPEQVIEHLEADQSAIYDSEKVEKIEIRKGVQGRYKQQVLMYYQKQDSLKGKASWITEEFIRERLS